MNIPLLVHAFNEEFCKAYEKPIKDYTAQSIDLLRKHPWPGNVRELRNGIERITLLVREETIQPRHVQGIIGGMEDRHDEVRIRLGTPLRAAEEQLIRQTEEWGLCTTCDEIFTKLIQGLGTGVRLWPFALYPNSPGSEAQLALR